MLNSIKANTLLSSISGIFLVLLVVVILANKFITTWFLGEFDQTIIAKVRLMQTLIEYDHDGLEFEFADEFMGEYSRENHPEYFQIWTEGKETLEKAKSLASADLKYIETSLEVPIVSDLRLPDGRAGRIVYIRFIAQNAQDEEDISEGVRIISESELPIVSIAIAKERAALDQVIFSANVIMFCGLLLVLLLSSFTIFLSVRKGLKPLDQLREEIKSLNYQKKGEKISIENVPKELSLLIKMFNRMIKDVQHNFEREQQFSSDIAHELRTPLAEIRTIAEVALIGNARDINEPLAGSMEDIILVNKQMEHLVNQLLLLARKEILVDELEFSEVNISQLVDKCLEKEKDITLEKKLSITKSVALTAVLKTSLVEITQIVCNIVSNSIHHSAKNTDINIVYKTNGEQFILTVENDRGLLEQSDLVKLDRRLWVKDSARSNGSRSGIGLALVKNYCLSLNYKIGVRIKGDRFQTTVSGKEH